MIGKILGNLIEIDGNEGLIETKGGVCYKVYLPPKILALQLPTYIEIYTYLRVREDEQVLYGFEDKDSYKMFYMLLSVDGIGPKTAHSIVKKMTAGEIINCVLNKELHVFTKVPGLGKKTAQKLILELSAKLKADLDIYSIIDRPINEDALAALISLGYQISEAKKMLGNVDSSKTTEEQIKSALQQRK